MACTCRVQGVLNNIESEDIKIVLLDREEVLRMLRNDEFHQTMMAAPLWKYFASHNI